MNEKAHFYSFYRDSYYMAFTRCLRIKCNANIYTTESQKMKNTFNKLTPGEMGSQSLPWVLTNRFLISATLMLDVSEPKSSRVLD